MRQFAYVGSYTSKKRGGLERGGISVFSRQAGSSWEELQVHEIENPSYLAFGKDKRCLYSVQADGHTISAFQIGEDGKLQLINQRRNGFLNGVYCEVSGDSKHLFVSSCTPENRAGGVVSFELEGSGAIGKICDVLIPTGKLGPLTTTAQAGVKPHQARFSPDGKYLLEVDKGLDAIHSYRVDEDGRLTLVSTMNWRPASCPRHIAFHPNGEWLYLVTEWIGTVVACRYCEGEVTPFAVYPTLPATYTGLKNSGAEIEVHPSGKWLYASNRGHNSLVRFEIADTGELTAPTWTTEGVRKPRFFTIAEDGKHLYCANEATHEVTIFEIRPDNGTLALTEEALHASAPACVLLK